jgi:FkbM family methyltransferase
MSIHGFRFYLNSIEAKYQFVFGCETFTSRVVRELVLRHNVSVFVDVGANRGWYSFFVKSLRKDVTVLAFEASAKIFSYLEQNRLLNPSLEIESKQVFVGQTTNMRDFYEYTNGANDGMGTAYPLKELDNTKVSRVKPTTLDLSLMHRESGVFLVKIDVEGAETDVIMGALDFLASNPFLIIELNPAFLENRVEGALIKGKSLFEFFEEGSYLQYWIDERGRLQSCSKQEPFPHVKLLGFGHGANYLFVSKAKLNQSLSEFIRSLGGYLD